jgi:hypothetical protein
LQKNNRDSFVIPEWFLYTSRAFLTLEGVSLSADPNYSIIASCFPYISKRLLGDDDPRARKALKDLLYGASDAVDVDRLSDLADGFSSYTATTKSLTQQETKGAIAQANGATLTTTSGDKERKRKMVEAEAAITLAKDSADVLLAREGNLVQNLLLEESALAASADFKDAVRKAFVDGPKEFRDSLPLGVGAFLPPLLFEQVEPFVRKTGKELKAQELAEKITKIAARSTPESGAHVEGGNRSSNEAASTLVKNLRELEPEQAALVLKELRENIPKYAPLLGQLSGKFVNTLLRTASFNIDTTLSELEKAGSPTDMFVRASAKRLSSAAQRLAKDSE